MLIPTHGVKLYGQCYTRGKVYSHCFTWIEALGSFLYMNRSFMLTWSDALCPLLCMELTHIE